MAAAAATALANSAEHQRLQEQQAAMTQIVCQALIRSVDYGDHGADLSVLTGCTTS